MAYITFTMFMIYFLTLTMRDVSIGKAHAGSDVRYVCTYVRTSVCTYRHPQCCP